MNRFQPGALVNVRNRDWVVMPSNDEDLVLIKPLGGSDEEVTGIYLPLEFEGDEIKSAELASAYLGIWLSKNKPISGPLFRTFFPK